jgi:hypothetical protein
MLHRNNPRNFVTCATKLIITQTYKKTANEADQSRQQRPSSGTSKVQEKRPEFAPAFSLFGLC